MKKSVIAAIIVIALIFSTVSVAGAAGGLGNFTQKYTYTNGTFTDIPLSQWYFNNVKRVYELGLMNGTGGGKFSPDGSVTVAEAVTLACRLYGIYHTGSAEFAPSDPWYQVYVDFATEKGIIKRGEYSDFDRAATRREFASILAAALPAEALYPINSVTEIPDVENNAANAAVYRLYNAGILTGNDERGTFTPNANISRAESAAIVTRMADISCRKTFTLKTYPKAADYFTRKLTDAELADLKGANLSTLRAKISTVSDATAYLDQFGALFYTATRNNDDYIVNLPQWFRDAKGNSVSPEVYTFIALYCISDDFDGIYAVEAVTSDNGTAWLATALALPVAEGYLINSPAADSRIKDNNGCLSFNLNSVTVPDLASIKDCLQIKPSPFSPDLQNMPILRIYCSEADVYDLYFDADNDLEETSGGARLLYEMSDAEKEAERARKADAAWRHMTSVWHTYGLPASMAPTLTRGEAEALLGKPPAEVAAKLKTVGDCMYYYCLAQFESKGNDLQTHVSGDFWWHYNYAPEAAFEHNFGCCGTISGLTAYFLEGDYETSGIISMTFAAGEGGGHVINYIYDGSRYYAFDMINWVASYYGYGLNLVSGSTAQQMGDNWEKSTAMWHEKLIVAYESVSGDMPMAWEWQTSFISYLPAQYRESATVLLETPSEGYVYEWVTVPDDIWNAIVSKRTDN